MRRRLCSLGLTLALLGGTAHAQLLSGLTVPDALATTAFTSPDLVIFSNTCLKHFEDLEGLTQEMAARGVLAQEGGVDAPGQHVHTWSLTLEGVHYRVGMDDQGGCSVLSNNTQVADTRGQFREAVLHDGKDGVNRWRIPHPPEEASLTSDQSMDQYVWHRAGDPTELHFISIIDTDASAQPRVSLGIYRTGPGPSSGS